MVLQNIKVHGSLKSTSWVSKEQDKGVITMALRMNCLTFGSQHVCYFSLNVSKIQRNLLCKYISQQYHIAEKLKIKSIK